MNLLDMVLQAQGGGLVNEMSKTVGLDTQQTSKAVQHLIPALTRAVQNNAASGDGLQSLLGALSQGNHADYVEHPERLAQPETVQDGNGILGHLLGSKDVSRSLAHQVSSETGIGEDLLKKLLPLAAAALMGSLSKGTQGGQAGGAGLLGLLTGDAGGSTAGQAMGLLGKLFGR